MSGMPLHWTVSHPQRLVIAIAKGEVQPQEVEKYLADMFAQGGGPYRKMFDVSQTERGERAQPQREVAVACLGREDRTEAAPPMPALRIGERQLTGRDNRCNLTPGQTSTVAAVRCSAWFGIGDTTSSIKHYSDPRV